MLSTPGWKNPDAIGFFFGAGASIEFGIPSMKQMTTSFATNIRNKASLSKERKIFDDIYNALARVYGTDNVDLEAIMTVIVGLKEGHIKDNIGDLGLFALAKKDALDFSNFKFDIDILDRLENKYRKYVRSRVIISNPDKIDFSRKVYTDFFKQICNVITCDNATAPDTDLRKFRWKKWTFFTTNYDNIIEDFWVEERKDHNLDLGFESKYGKKLMNPDQFLHSNTEQFNVISAMQLVKLHGSVNWVRNKDNKIEEHSYHLSLDEISSRRGSKDITEDLLIYPLTQKELYFTPFIQLFDILNKDLDRRFFWIIIGYSFRDIIIRTMFEKALLEDNRRKLLLVHPQATKLIRPLFKESIQSQVVCLDE